MIFMAEKTNVYPYRAPKKYPKKDLHGRPRFLLLSSNDFKRFQKFYVNVFGWDMIETPEAASGIPAGDPHPGMLVATGPAQYDYEGVTPGDMNLFVHWAPGELEKIGPFMEIDMDHPLEETIKKIADENITFCLP